MKKMMSLLLVLALTAAFVGCGSKDDGKGAGQTEDAAATTAGQTEAATTAAADKETEAATTAAADGTAAGTGAEVMTYEEYVAADLDTEVVVETYVQAKQSWWEDKATLYTQDHDGAYFIYELPCTEEDYARMTPGTKIRVSGFKAEWSGEIEIIDASFEFVEGSDSFVAEPEDVSALLGTDELIDHQNQFVSFKGMTVEPVDPENADCEDAFWYRDNNSGQDGDDLYFRVSLDGEAYTFTVESYLCDNTTEVYAAVKNLKIGDKIDMEGFLYWYNGVNPHITSVTAAE